MNEWTGEKLVNEWMDGFKLVFKDCKQAIPNFVGVTVMQVYKSKQHIYIVWYYRH
jgi:hypothetical protein